MESYVFNLPDLGEGVVEGEIVAWHVQEGDSVSEDQPLVDIMTDKATVTIPSIVAGQVLKTRGNVGDTIAVGEDLIRFEIAEGTETPAVNGAVNQGKAGTVEVPAMAPVALPVTTDRPMASPAVRRRAREKGVDLSKVHGTGRGGRITDADVENFLRSGSVSPGRAARIKRTGTTEIHLAGLRRRIAEKMSTSHAHIPHFSYIDEVDITELAELRNHLNENRSSDEQKLSYLPFVMLALSKAFEKFPTCNAHYDDDREVVTRFEAVHLGIATQTDRGLYVPVIKNVEAMDLREAARELHRITQATRHGTIGSKELKGSTFTITSLGKMGGLAATPIINHPEVAILGIHKAYDRPVVHNGQIAIRHIVNLSGSFDHRVVDGLEGAALIQAVKDYLEHPALIFLD